MEFNKVHLDNDEISKIYLGDVLVYEKEIPFSSRGAIFGDSTISSQDGSNDTAYYIFTEEELTAGYSYNSLAVSGETINQQLGHWNNLTELQKQSFNWAIFQIGLNDLGNPIATILSDYQNLIDTVKSTGKAGVKIITCTFIPSEIGGDYEGYANWLSFNAAIRGIGSTVITGMDAMVDKHTDILNDGTDQMKPIYWNNGTDGSHPNNTARNINAKCWRDAMIELGIISGTVAEFTTPVLTSGTITANTAIINWSAITGAQAYKLERATNIGFTTGVTKIYLGDNLTYTDIGLAPETNYYYRLQAIGVGYHRSAYGTKSITTDSGEITPVDLLSGFTFVNMGAVNPDWFVQDGSNVGKWNTIGNDRQGAIPYDLDADGAIIMKGTGYRLAIWLTATNDIGATEVASMVTYEAGAVYGIATTEYDVPDRNSDTYFGFRKTGNNLDIIMTNNYGASYTVVANVGTTTAKYLWFYSTGGGHVDYLQNKI